MANSDSELERFKTEINLIDFALEKLGFELDQPRGSANPASLRLKGPQGKIVISGSPEGRWVYFSVHDPENKGTIIDLVKREMSLSLGEARRLLRGYLGGTSISRPYDVMAEHVAPSPPPRRQDGKAARRQIIRAVESAKIITQHPLLEARGISQELLLSPLFSGTIRANSRGNLIFPHRDEKNSVCGYEYKGEGFGGYSKGGTKGLWLSNRPPKWQRLVLCESVIDALSYYLMFPWDDAQYAATAGGWGPKLDPFLLTLANELPSDGMIVAAFDNDKQGDHYTERIVKLFENTDYELFLHQPKLPGSDWNDMLRCNPVIAQRNLAGIARS